MRLEVPEIEKRRRADHTGGDLGHDHLTGGIEGR
jgi:hypothetical protein